MASKQRTFFVYLSEWVSGAPSNHNSLPTFQPLFRLQKQSEPADILVLVAPRSRVFSFLLRQVYKKKTENAKKEYLKALAAYRASLISKVSTEYLQSVSAEY